MWDALRSAAHSHHAGFEVDVSPHESQRFALTQAERQGDRVKGLEAVTSRGVKQAACVGRRERQHFAPRHARS